MAHNINKLISKAQKGEQEAMQKLYKMHERVWFRLCLRYGQDRTEAQDLLQEGLVQIFRDLSQFDPDRGNFQSWSNGVLIHAALGYLKKHKKHQWYEVLEMEALPNSKEHTIIDRITAKEITALIQALPLGYRVVFNMHVLDGYSHREIAAILGIAEGTSKSQLAKARKVLRQQVEILF